MLPPLAGWIFVFVFRSEMVSHAYNPSTLETEVKGLQFLGQPGLHSKGPVSKRARMRIKTRNTRLSQEACLACPLSFQEPGEVTAEQPCWLVAPEDDSQAPEDDQCCRNSPDHFAILREFFLTISISASVACSNFNPDTPTHVITVLK